jgi:primosomal protein N' (replication factor Y) (superfamily II helicase)
LLVKVLLNNTSNDLNKVFDYLIPDNLIDEVEIGKRVKVNFGKSNRFEEGIIVKIEKEYILPKYKIKYIDSILDNVSYINEDRLKLAKWMAYVYFCNVYDCLKLMLPPGTNNINNSKEIKNKIKKVLILNKTSEEINNLIDSNVIKSPKHIYLLRFLIDNENVTISDVISGLNISRSIINNLIEKEYIIIEEQELDKQQELDILPSVKLNPTKEQEQAIKGINDLINDNKFSQALLFGVTGSGKTEVYLQVIEEVLNKGKNVIVLVPEISLTHQTMSRFISRFGNIVSILHSKMSISDRKSEYLNIKLGKSKIVIGARSAIFAPVDNIGLIIIDEEHDSSYYSMTKPKYSTKEVANYIANNNNAVVLLGSATPEVSTYYKCIEGSIKLFELKNRPGNVKLPQVIIEDKNIDSLNNREVITRRLKDKIIETINKKEQVMIFLNKRGYSSYLTCNDCGYVFKCDNCDVAMTYHKNSNLLLCHYCSSVKKNITTCNKCNSTNLRQSSFGTEKIEEELKNIIPGLTTIRMDRDTTIVKDSHKNILEKFKNENINLLIGTQMISKGHDIDNVTLVGVLGTDSILNNNDYLSSEKAYSNISQVAGRAGRKEKEGTVIIETKEVDNIILNCALNHDYISFYNTEIEFRKKFNFPPFVDLINFEISGINNNIVKEESFKLYDILKNSNELYNIYTPKSAYIEKINNKFRFNILIKTKLTNTVFKKIYENLEIYNKNKNKNVNISLTRNI